MVRRHRAARPVAELQHDAGLPCTRHEACHRVALAEAQRADAETLQPGRDILGRVDTRLEPCPEKVVVEVLADESELAHAFLAWPPHLGETTDVDHVHGLIHELGVAVVRGDHALHPVELRAQIRQQPIGHPLAQQVDVNRSLLGHAERCDRRVVLVLAVGVEELGVHLERAREVKGADVEHARHVDARLLAAHDRRERVDAAQPRLDTCQVILRHEISLVEQQSVRKRHLLYRLVLRALGLLLVEMLLDVLRVDERHDAVEPCERLDRVIHEEGLRDGRRVGHPRGLDDDAVEVQLARRNARGELGDDGNQVGPHGAADAAVHHLDDLLVGLHLGVRFE